MLSQLFFRFLTEFNIHSLLFSLNRSMAAVFDDAYVHVLRSNFQVLKKMLLPLLNSIIETDLVPQLLKRAVVRPLYRLGASDTVESYRSISILSCTLKVLEKDLLFATRIIFGSFEIMSPCQHRFIAVPGTHTLFDNFARFLC